MHIKIIHLFVVVVYFEFMDKEGSIDRFSSVWLGIFLKIAFIFSLLAKFRIK